MSSGYVLMLGGVCMLLLSGCTGGASDTAAGGDSASAASSATYKPTPPQPVEVGTQLIGPRVYTIDARSKDVWIYFDFSRASVVVVQDPKKDDWDLAFRRYVIHSNGGATHAAAQAALLSLPGQPFEAVQEVPADAAFQADVRTTRRPFPYNPVVDKWYVYNYLSNVLVPKPAVYLVRTQDGKYAKMRLLSYYCDGHISGCMTFEYVYQGNGSPRLSPSPAG